MKYREPEIVDHAERAGARLRFLLSVIAMSVGMIYVVVDRLNGVSGSTHFYAGVVALGALSMFLNRKRRYFYSSVVLMAGINIIVFIFADSDHQNQGYSIYFLVTAITALALFGYSHIAVGFAFSGLSLVLMLASLLTDFDFVTVRTVPEEVATMYLVLNVATSLITAVSILYSLLLLNHLVHKEIEKDAIQLKQGKAEISAKNQELMKANEELDRFVYSVSHDLRAPLRSVLGLLNLYSLSQSQEERNGILQLVRGRVDKLDVFIREILDFSRNARVDIQTTWIQLDSLVKEVLESIGYIKGFDAVTFRIDLPEEAVATDVDRLRVVLNNLLVNSVKYADASKERSEVTVQGRLNATALHLTVSDNGIGIHPERLPRIFDMFYRAHDHSDGSGLGLYIVREVIAKMGGQVRVSSQQGIGSTFDISLPLSSAAERPSAVVA
jgi:signal transduction histidine kinase